MHKVLLSGRVPPSSCPPSLSSPFLSPLPLPLTYSPTLLLEVGSWITAFIRKGREKEREWERVRERGRERERERERERDITTTTVTTTAQYTRPTAKNNNNNNNNNRYASWQYLSSGYNMYIWIYFKSLNIALFFALSFFLSQIKYRVFRKKCVFYSSLQPLPLLHRRAVRDLQSSQRNASEQSLLAECWRGKGGKFSRILGKKPQYLMNTLYLPPGIWPMYLFFALPVIFAICLHLAAFTH